MQRALATLLLLLTVCGCEVPPPASFAGAVSTEGSIDLGTNAGGEPCRQETTGTENADIYCKDQGQPAGSVRRGGAVGSAELAQLATSSEWRLGLNLRYVCEAPAPAALAHAQEALLLRCTRRVGGWPHVALIARVDGNAWFADGIPTLLPVLERSIGVLSGHQASVAASASRTPTAQRELIDRLSAKAFTQGDVGEYYRLMALGARANLSEDFAAAASAYRAALKLQQTALGNDNPNTAVPLMSLALQLSNQGQFSEADRAFQTAARLAPNATDPAAQARLMHYRALHLINQGRDDDALALLDKAERAYSALVPPEVIAASRSGGAKGGIEGFPNQRVLIDPVAQSAVMGLVEVKRYRSVALRKTGQTDTARPPLQDAAALATANGLMSPLVDARVGRTAAEIDVAETGASALLGRSAEDFRLSLPLTRPFAVTELLRAAARMGNGDVSGALEGCHAAVAVLRELKLGIEQTLLEPCLSALATRAERSPEQRQALYGEMFEVAELGQGSITSQLIAQASARLTENARDPRVGQTIRRRQDAAESLNALYRTRDALARANTPGGTPYDGPRTDPNTLDKQIATALDELKDSDAAVQETAPNYGQLVQQVVPARDVLALLRPGEAFAQITIGAKETWTLLLRDGQISLGRSETGIAAMTRLVVRLRASLTRKPDGALPAFATGPAHSIFAATLGTVWASLSDATALVVVPSGPLLSIPFALLLTEDFDGNDLRAAPWLLRTMSLTHVPSATNFAGLRRAAGGSHAMRPWFGFGDFRPVTRAEAARSFPGPACADAASVFAALPPLPRSLTELETSRSIVGASATELLLGQAFTADAVRHAPLKNYRIIHIATHALLPSDFECQPQPLIVTSAPRGAATADGAMLLADDVLALDLDADAVILSACNSGGRGGKLAGESLSALARAFFYAGSRSLLATHWSLNDAAGERLVSGLLRNYTSSVSDGLAQSLRMAQLALLASAGSGGVPAEVAHPFFWAPMALIGEGGARHTLTATALKGPS
ncbi:MAG TPA: CHAT domain-containing protein [Acetobacteraceae bacterium]|nr:CHAT domain-containing protein [Acetobacteraceae bacterium]